MRIIHGKFKGFRLPEYKGSNTRPTSDLVKESLFNSLESIVEIEGSKIIDLFAGTGNIGIEFLSRSASHVTSIDLALSNIKYMDKIKKELKADNWEIIRADVLDFIDNNDKNADIVFADPPYDYASTHTLVNKILDADWFKNSDSVFILEHIDRLVFNHKQVFLKKQYGNTCITGFRPA